MKVMVALNEDNRRVGQTHPAAKLSDADIDLVFALREAGLSFGQIAAKFDVQRACIHKVISGQRRAQIPVRWKAVDDTPAPRKRKPKPAEGSRRKAPEPVVQRDTGLDAALRAWV
jgi:hypothetical protein